jgi:hypothetical protein
MRHRNTRRCLTTHRRPERPREGCARRAAALELDPQPVRFYPNSGGYPDTTLASQLLGFVTDDGQGRYGIEQFGQDLLAGTDSRRRISEGTSQPTLRSAADG